MRVSYRVTTMNTYTGLYNGEEELDDNRSRATGGGLGQQSENVLVVPNFVIL